MLNFREAAYDYCRLIFTICVVLGIILLRLIKTLVPIFISSFSPYIHFSTFTLPRKSLSQILKLTFRVRQTIFPPLNSFASWLHQMYVYRLNQTVMPTLVARTFPPHSTSQSVMSHIFRLL